MMKRYMSVLLVLLLSMGLLLSGCNGNQQQQEEEQPQQQEEVQQPEVEQATLTGEYQGLADGHSAEIIVDGEAQVYQFFDEAVAAALEPMETGTTVQFDVEIDAETSVRTIVNVYDMPAEG